MIKNEYGILFLTCFLGMLLSFLYFGSLWLSIQWLIKKKKVFMLAFTGLFVRLTVFALAIFFVVTQWHLKGLCSFLLGFFLMKYVLKYQIKTAKEKKV